MTNFDDMKQEQTNAGSRHLQMATAYERELNKYAGQLPAEPARKKRSAARSMFAAFMAGAIAVGGLMYGADRGQWFTGGDSSGGPVSSAVSSALQDAGLTTASSGSTVESDISEVYEQASPAVVLIENYGETRQSMYGASQFDYFFGGGRQQQPDNTESELQLTGEGTGFFFDKSGYILTNEHVIDGAKELKVTVEGYDEPFTATVVGSSEELDLAVLKVEGDGDFPYLTLGDSDGTQIGDWVIAIGNPYGFDHTMTVGVLSAKERPITVANDDGTEQVYEHLLQTDASINPGNSGGPLLNASGQVIGINTAVSAEAQGIGFAIPASTIKSALESLMTNSL